MTKENILSRDDTLNKTTTTKKSFCCFKNSHIFAALDVLLCVGCGKKKKFDRYFIVRKLRANTFMSYSVFYVFVLNLKIYERQRECKAILLKSC